MLIFNQISSQQCHLSAQEIIFYDVPSKKVTYSFARPLYCITPNTACFKACLFLSTLYVPVLVIATFLLLSIGAWHVIGMITCWIHEQSPLCGFWPRDSSQNPKYHNALCVPIMPLPSTFCFHHFHYSFLQLLPQRFNFWISLG